MWILVLLLVALALLISSREHFNPATERPKANDPSLLNAVASMTGLNPVADKMKIDKYVTAIQSFYDTKFLPKKETPTTDQIKTFTDPQTDTDIDKQKLGQIIEYVFLSTAQPPPPAPTTPTSTGTTGGQTTGGTSTTSAGPTSGGTTTGGTTTGGNPLLPSTSSKGLPGRKVWGPEFPGLGDGGYGDGEDTTGKRNYPELVGPGGDISTMYPGAGIGAPSKNWQLAFNGSLPSFGSLGSEEMSKYLPFSRVPGDMDKIPNPYSIASTFTTSSYSSKTEPVPFLTDFSAFQK